LKDVAKLLIFVLRIAYSYYLILIARIMVLDESINKKEE